MQVSGDSCISGGWLPPLMLSVRPLTRMPSQPTPTVTSADVERVVRRDFPADRFTEVLAILAEYGTERWHREPDRVRLAALKLTAGGFVHLRRVDAQANEVSPPSTGALPLFPVVHAHPPPQPLVHRRDLSIGLADTEVVQPSHHVAPQFAQHAVGRDATAATGDGLHPFLEPLPSPPREERENALPVRQMALQQQRCVVPACPLRQPDMVLDSLAPARSALQAFGCAEFLSPLPKRLKSVRRLIRFDL